MKISIITINYNDKEGLQKTFNSVFNQTHKDLEYIVIDGGSTEGSKEIIEENSSEISYWVSEKDEGVYDAMNKGIRKATGEYILFLNSGDFLENAQVLSEVSHFGGADILYGNVLLEDKGKSELKTYSDKIDYAFLFESAICHQVMFFNKTLFDRFGFYRTDLKIISDWEYYFRLLVKEQISFKYIPLTISIYNMEGMSNDETQKDLLIAERDKVKQELFPLPIRELLGNYNELQKKYQGLMSSKSVLLALKIGKTFK